MCHVVWNVDGIGKGIMCKISIIMPVYNKVNYVEKAIESIQKQTFLDWELIIVDDGSTDGSDKKCDVYGEDFRITVTHLKHGGVSRARNFGLKMARGKYITFVDGDDCVEPEFLEKLYIPDQEMIIGGLLRVNHEGGIVAKVIPLLYGEYEITDVAKGFYEEQNDSGIYGFAGGKLIQRKLIEEHGITFDEKIPLAEDYDFFLKVYSFVKSICFRQYAGYRYLQGTVNSAAALNDFEIDFFTQIEIQNRAKAFLIEKASFGDLDKIIYLRIVTGYVYTILLINKGLKYNEFLKLSDRLKELVPVVTLEISGLQKFCITLYDRNEKKMLYLIMKLLALTGR